MDNIEFLADPKGYLRKIYYAENAEKTRRGMRLVREAGGFPHRAPFGYLNAETDGKKIVKVDARTAHVVRRAFEMAAEGAYPAAITRKLFAEGLRTRSGKPVLRQALARMLANPFYMGLIRNGDEWVSGAHIPLVSQETFIQAQ